MTSELTPSPVRPVPSADRCLGKAAALLQQLTPQPPETQPKHGASHLQEEAMRGFNPPHHPSKGSYKQQRNLATTTYTDNSVYK